MADHETYQIETEIRDEGGKLLVRPTINTDSPFSSLPYRMNDLCEAAPLQLGLPGAIIPYRVTFTVRLVEIAEEHDEDGPWESRTVVRELTCDRWVR